MSIGEAIKNLRLSAGLSQTGLASKVNVSAPMITMIERGTKVPSLPLSKAIADALGCSIVDLLGEPDTENAAL